jgi:hypothetical protein
MGGRYPLTGDRNISSQLQSDQLAEAIGGYRSIRVMEHCNDIKDYLEWRDEEALRGPPSSD